MQIRIDNDGTAIKTTLAALLDALEAVTNNEGEMEAVLLNMLDEHRIHFFEEPAMAA